MQDRFCWASLQAAADLGNRSLMRLWRHFRSGQAALDAGRAELQQVPKLAPQAIEKMISVRGCADPDQTFQDLTAAEIKLIMLGDPDYPSLLAEIADPPVLFYLKGVLPAASVPLIALVGARQATPYGLAVARQIAQELAEAGWGVVSGMAQGDRCGSTYRSPGWERLYAGCFRLWHRHLLSQGEPEAAG